MIEVGIQRLEVPATKELSSPQGIIIVGPEGSGKSTQAALLSKKLHLPHISIGEEFRNLEHSGPQDLWLRFKEVQDTYRYVDQGLYDPVFRNRFKKSDVKEGFVLEGVFRLPFEREMGNMLKDLGLDFPLKTFYLRAPVWECARRMQVRGRVGYDTDEGIVKRLTKFYGGLGQRMADARQISEFQIINVANKSPQEVNNEILKNIA